MMVPSIACFALPNENNDGIKYSVTYNPNKPDGEIAITALGATRYFPISNLEWLRDSLSEIASYERERKRQLNYTTPAVCAVDVDEEMVDRACEAFYRDTSWRVNANGSHDAIRAALTAALTQPEAE